MAQSRLFSIYERMPIWAQNVACTLAGYRIRRQRYNATFFRALDFLEKSQWWSPAEQQAYQAEQIQKIIARAYEHVPYYRQVMQERKLVPSDIRGRGTWKSCRSSTKRRFDNGTTICKRATGPPTVSRRAKQVEQQGPR